MRTGQADSRPPDSASWQGSSGTDVDWGPCPVRNVLPGLQVAFPTRGSSISFLASPERVDALRQPPRYRSHTSLTPGGYETLLRLISTATSKIVTRKTLSEQSRGAESATAGGLRELLSAEPKLASVKCRLDQAISMLSRPSPCPDETCTMVDAIQARASAGTGKKANDAMTGASAAASPTSALKSP